MTTQNHHQYCSFSSISRIYEQLYEQYLFNTIFQWTNLKQNRQPSDSATVHPQTIHLQPNSPHQSANLTIQQDSISFLPILSYQGPVQPRESDSLNSIIDLPKAYYNFIVIMAYRQNQASRPNDTYNSIREQLERETQALIQERGGINVQRPSVNNVPSYNNFEPQGRPSYPIASQKKAELKGKIKEIIDLCNFQNAAVTKDIAGVADAQKGIFNLLQQTEAAFLEGQTAPGIPSYTPSAYTPIRAGQLDQTGKNLQKDIKSILQVNSQVQLSQEALQLINQIERRSLAQIQKLRNEKLDLINQLNDQIRRHNAEKKRSVELERELDFYRKKQGNIGDGRYENELKERVAFLENKLMEAQRVPEGFKGDLNDFQILFAQGEAIRQETLRLLRLKEAKGFSDDAEKRHLREQVERLQRKVEQLQGERGGRQGKASYQVINEQYSPISQSRKQKDSYRASANQYQSLLMQMRKITAK